MQKKKTKILKSIILTIIVLLSFQTVILAHSGRTDANGGHKDNKNKSGLGSYHYHCGGYPAHLHTNGVCPYKSSSTGTSNTQSSSKSSSTSHPISTNSSNQSSSSSSKTTQTTTTYTKSTEENKTVEVTAINIQNKEKTTLKIGESLKLNANIEPAHASDKTVIWISSNTNLATVNSEGKVELLEAGTVTITAKSSNGKEDSIKINIEKQVVEGTKIILDKNSVYLNEGDILQIVGTVYPTDANEKTITWESSDEKFAKVENGKVTAIKEGTVDIIATSNNGIKAICKVNIKKSKEELENQSNSESNNFITPAIFGTTAIAGGGVGLGIAYRKRENSNH